MYENQAHYKIHTTVLLYSYAATADHCTAPPPIIPTTTTQIQVTYEGGTAAVPTQSPQASNLLPPPIMSADYLIIAGVIVAVVVIVTVTLVAVVTVGVKASRRGRHRSLKDELSLVGSGTYAAPLLDMAVAPATHPTESVGT